MGICRATLIELGPTQIQVDCYVLPLGRVDIVLRVAWLETLGEVRSNWTEFSMKFKQEDGWVTLKGDSTMVRSTILAQSLQKMGDIDFCALIRAAEILGVMGGTCADLDGRQKEAQLCYYDTITPCLLNHLTFLPIDLRTT